MNIKLMLDDKRFKTKPTATETGAIQKRIKPTTISIEELAIGLSNGMTCKPAVLSGSKSSSWTEQNIFMLDVDHNSTINEQIQVCNDLGIHPVFMYTSFSHSETEHHFRICFITDSIITDIDVRNKLQITLIKIFDKSDKVTYDPTRIFFGGSGLVPINPNYDARINAEDIIAKYYKEEYNISKPPKTVKKVKVDNHTSKPKEPLTDAYMDNIDAIRTMDVEKLRSLITVKNKVIVTSEKEIYNFINNIDLTDLLGFEEGYAINCILDDHDDSTPSGYIFKTKDGTQIYKCFGCGKALSITSLVEVLAHTTRRKALDFIKQVYGVKLYQSPWVLEQKEILKSNIQYLDSDDILIDFPSISKLIRTRKVHIKALMTYFEQFISDDLRLNDMPIFFGGYTKLMEVCSINPNKRTTFSQSTTLFALLDMMLKVKQEDIPEKELKKAQSISMKYGYKKITNFYQFSELGYNQLQKSESIARNLLENNISLKGIGREYVLRTFGTELCGKVFPQFRFENEQGTSQKTDDFTLYISKFILENIEVNGFCKEKDIKINDKTETQFKKSIQEILDTYGLVKVRASKANKELYNIPNDIAYQSNVICREINN